jgi:hypothetical protein
MQNMIPTEGERECAGMLIKQESMGEGRYAQSAVVELLERFPVAIMIDYKTAQ